MSNGGLQLFESTSQQDSARDYSDREDNHTNSTPSPGKKQIVINHKRLHLQLDEIENNSDYDVDSIKNTSARAITFNQFEQTKNHTNNGPNSSVNHSTLDIQNTSDMGDLDASKKLTDKLNASHLELINQATEMGSAISTERKTVSMGMYQSISLELDPAARRKSALERK